MHELSHTEVFEQIVKELTVGFDNDKCEENV